jgi:hypothetical protein
MIDRHSGRVLLGAGAIVVVLLAAAVFVFSSYWWASPARSPVTITVAAGCPRSIAGHHGVRNRGLGFWFHLVPGGPGKGLICAYQPSDPSTPDQDLLGQASLNASQATKLAVAVNKASTRRRLPSACAGVGTPDIVMAFSYRHRRDVDLWYDSRGPCGMLTNGRLNAAPGGLPEMLAAVGESMRSLSLRLGPDH